MASGQKVREYEHKKMISSLSNLIRDNYGPDRKVWPKINIIILKTSASDVDSANKILSEDFGGVLRTFRGDGVVIEDIKDYMSPEELELFYKYKGLYSSK